MSATRIHYPVLYPAISEHCLGSGYHAIHGVQSVTLNTTFNLEQVFELGQLDIYENVETVPDIEVSIEKVLDGYALVYHEATQTATSPTLLNRAGKQCDLLLSIFDDEQDNASGTPLTQALCSGLYVESISYSLPVDGQATESVTLVGNDKEWRTAGFWLAAGQFDGTDTPASGVQRRQNVIMGAAPTGSIWPADITGLTVSNGSGYNVAAGDTFVRHIQDVTISVNLNRNSLFELGKRREFFRFAQFPTEVTCEINILAGGTDPGDGVDALGDNEANLTNQPIMIKLDDSTIFNLGTRNKLSSITFSGAEAQGGEGVWTYTYSNFNILQITQNNDPAGQ